MPEEKSSDERTGSARRAAAVVAGLALLVLAVTALLLTWRYRPAGYDEVAPASVRWSRQLVRWQGGAMGVAVLALVVWAALVGSDGARRPRRRVIGVATAAVAVALVALTASAWQRIRWEQLALWAVTLGTDVQGVWDPVFSDEVRFAFVGGTEVSPDAMAPWVIVHLVAPVVALVVFVAGCVLSTPRRPSPRAAIPRPADEPFDLEVLPRDS
jgi:hypothetical protein